MKNKEYWISWAKAAGVRAVKTIAQTFVATIGTAAVLQDVNWIMVLSASLLSGVISIATSVSFYDVYADMIAYDENRQDMTKEKYFAMSVSRRDRLTYKHSVDEILEKYKNEIKNYGRYPKSISDAMGDTFFMGRFENLDDAMKFQEFIREK